MMSHFFLEGGGALSRGVRPQVDSVLGTYYRRGLGHIAALLASDKDAATQVF